MAHYNPRLAFRERTTTSPYPNRELVAEGQSMAHFQLPVAAPHIFPNFDTTIDQANKKYRPVFRNHAEAETAEGYMKSKYNVEGTMTSDIPNTDHQNEGYIRMLYEAVYDMSSALDGFESDSYHAICKASYSEGSLHIVLWNLLKLIGYAQRGICCLQPWYTPEGPQYKRYESFVERLAGVELALRQSKAACRSLLGEMDFPARLAWNPIKEFRRKKDNQKINERKRLQKEEDKKLSNCGNKVAKNVQPQRGSSRPHARAQAPRSRRSRQPSSMRSRAPTVSPVDIAPAPEPAEEPHGYMEAQPGPGTQPSAGARPCSLNIHLEEYRPELLSLGYPGHYPHPQHYGMIQQQYPLPSPYPPPHMRFQTQDPMLGANPHYPVTAGTTAHIKREHHEYEGSMANALATANNWEQYRLQRDQQEHSYIDDLFKGGQPDL